MFPSVFALGSPLVFESLFRSVFLLVSLSPFRSELVFESRLACQLDKAFGLRSVTPMECRLAEASAYSLDSSLVKSSEIPLESPLRSLLEWLLAFLLAYPWPFPTDKIGRAHV